MKARARHTPLERRKLAKRRKEDGVELAARNKALTDNGFDKITMEDMQADEDVGTWEAYAKMYTSTGKMLITNARNVATFVTAPDLPEKGANSEAMATLVKAINVHFVSFAKRLKDIGELHLHMKGKITGDLLSNAEDIYAQYNTLTEDMLAVFVEIASPVAELVVITKEAEEELEASASALVEDDPAVGEVADELMVKAGLEEAPTEESDTGELGNGG